MLAKGWLQEFLFCKLYRNSKKENALYFLILHKINIRFSIYCVEINSNKNLIFLLLMMGNQ